MKRALVVVREFWIALGVWGGIGAAAVIIGGWLSPEWGPKVSDWQGSRWWSLAGVVACFFLGIMLTYRRERNEARKELADARRELARLSDSTELINRKEKLIHALEANSAKAGSLRQRMEEHFMQQDMGARSDDKPIREQFIDLCSETKALVAHTPWLAQMKPEWSILDDNLRNGLNKLSAVQQFANGVVTRLREGAVLPPIPK